ncbi:MAG: bifunctional 5,10-methylenetetrahydrofolate dehydrogenase/5,10-methenyltetrahydrofolate cyclohydrolase [Candidatus Omnitrophota bacterium]|jgi:methylenetetrahydrofolate dehydrogenase (NADP+)/methenyltetrahydrofolate cyclohydrolase
MTQEAKLLEGKILAQAIQDQIRAEVREIAARGEACPKLVALQASRDASAEWYLGQQEKLAAKLGIQYEKIPAERLGDPKTLEETVRRLNGDPGCHGVFITMPLPEGFDSDAILLALDPRKDVEGIHPANLGLIVLRRAKLLPPTAYAAYRLIEWAVKQSGRPMRGMRAVIAGQSAIVGRPLQLLLGEQRVTTTVCNTGTSEAELKAFVGASDLVVACAGKPGLIMGDWIKPGAVVIDVGTTEVEGKLKGDVDFEGAKKRAAFLTPVPGGVGPLTVTMLMQNLIHACKWQQGRQR